MDGRPLDLVRSWILVLAVVVTASASAQQPKPPQSQPHWELARPDARQQAMARSGFKPEPGRQYASIWLPPAISTEETDRWARRLQLSEAQTKVFESLIDRYEHEYPPFRERVIDPLWKQAAIAGECSDHLSQVECAQILQDLLRDRDAVVKQLEALEDRIFVDLEPILAEHQLPALRSVRLDRSRARLFFITFERIASAVDLTLLLDEIGQSMSIEPIDPVAFASLRTSYEETITDQLNRYQRALMKARAGGSIALAAMDQEVDPATGSKVTVNSARTRLMSQRRDALWRQVNAIERRLVTINRTYAELLGNLLASETSKAF